MRKNVSDYHQPQILEHSTIFIKEEEETGRFMHSWGSRKDGRVFQSEKSDSCGVHTLEIGEIMKITCGTNHSLMTNEEGKVFGWGKNDLNQICTSTKKNNYIIIPQEIKFKTKIVEIAAGWGHSLALSDKK